MDNDESLAVALAEIRGDFKARDERAERMAQDIAYLRKHLSENYVHVEAFKPLQRLVSLVSTGFALAVVAAIASLVLKS